VLARGYAVLDDPETGRIVRAATETAPGQKLRVRLAAGELTVRVEDIITHPESPDS
jgi:exodeoxyribonuclease VII large subunit